MYLCVFNCICTEKNGWALDIAEIEKSVQSAQHRGICVRALVFINPGNPTGQCLSEENIVQLIQYCYHHRIVLIADEVYQENIYDAANKPFISARRVLNTMSGRYCCVCSVLAV